MIVVGLGPGDPQLLTLQARRVLDEAREIWARTARHPALAGRPVQSFDAFYERCGTFEEVSATIAGELRRLAARPEGAVYAVPGHPLVGERSVSLLLDTPGLRIVPGLSFIDAVLPLLGLDALEGLQLLDALQLGARLYPDLEPNRPALVGPLWSRAAASDLKLTLMPAYPAEHPVKLVLAAGTAEARVVDVPLAEIDRHPLSGDVALYLPPLPEPGGLPALAEVVARLRAPDGCPWDREQTHHSLRSFLIGEAYEVLEALDAGDQAALAEELGDLLFQIAIHVQLEMEAGGFTWREVIASIVNKLVRRHPHVFGEASVRDAEEVLERWADLKAAERSAGASLLSGIPASLPALARAQTVEERASQAGFDWPDVEGVWTKVEEELAELRRASTAEERQAELGDVVFVLVNLARWMKVDAETALRETVRRFSDRFEEMERLAHEAGRRLADLDFEEQNALWDRGSRGARI